MTDARVSTRADTPAPEPSPASARAPGALRLVVGLTIVGALLPFSGLPAGSVYIAATATLTALHTWGLIRHRPQPPWLWLLIAASLWILVVGDLVAVTVSDDAGEPVLAVGYLLGLVAAGAIVRLRDPPEPGTLLDALLVTAVVGAVLWQVSVSPGSGAGGEADDTAVRVLISALHVAGLFLVARLLTSGQVPPGLWLFTAGFSLSVIIDVATTTTGQSYLEPAWVSIIILSRGFFAALTLSPATRNLVPRHRVTRGPAPRRRLIALAALLAIVLVPVLAAVALEGRIELWAYVVLVPCAALALGLRVWRLLGEHERTNKRLLHDSHHDPLTGLPNRRSLTEHMQETLEESGSPGLAVLYCDLDDFKLLNDRLGHAAGDECLRILARRLAGVLRPDDLLGRIGGDEFVMSCRDVGSQGEAQAIARRVADAVNQPLVVQDREIELRMSIGVRYAEPGASAEQLITDADAAMYTAKRSAPTRGLGGPATTQVRQIDGIAVHDPLGDAIRRDQLRLHLQPICRLDTGRLTSVEALVRWQHPVRGLLPPDDFVPLAERTGLIDELGRWTLREACRWLGRERARGFDPAVSVSVNVSTRQLTGDRLYTDLLEAVEAADVPPDRVCLEITESILFADRDTARGLLERLRDLGVRLAIDDFGTGYSSLAALSWLPIDTLKLDRSFTTSLHAFGRERAVARAAVHLGSELGLSVVAEGVERPRQWNLLRELGCDEAQGFLLGQPGPALNLEAPGWTAGRPVGPVTGGSSAWSVDGTPEGATGDRGAPQ